MALNLKTETVFTDDSPAAQPPLPPEQIAPHFPQLEILECLGRGGMGVVYKARQKTLNRLVALKLLAPERVRDVKFAGRFTREAQALAALNHPNIVTIHDFGQAGGFYFLLMEFVDGVNLRQLLRARKFTPEEALTIVPPLCDALQFAHERGIVHRDIKPENLLLDKAGRVKVADFGIAKMLGADHGGNGGGTAAPENATQNAVGTPGYSAPEQKSDPQRVDSRADIYSLGVVFYEMLTGELPGKRIEPPSKKVQIDVRLDEVVLRALEKTPERRWQTAADLRTQVETISKTSHSGIPPGGAITAADLNGMRLRVLIWGLALAAAGVSMNFAFGTWGVLLFVTSATLALFFGTSLKMLAIACRLLLIDGIVMASAAIWFAYNSADLPTPWRVTIVAGCFLGIGYCLSCWAKLNALNTAIQKPAVAAWQRRFRKFFLVQLPVAFVITMVIRTFFLQPFRAATDAAAPEIPRGSQFLVWKLSHTFAPGDLIAYRQEGWAYVGRVARNEGGVISVNRNGNADIVVPSDAILGRVVSVYWRAANGAASGVVLRPSNYSETSVNGTDTRMTAKGVPLDALISYAYGPPTVYLHRSGNRVILPPGVADGKFDFSFKDSDRPQEALQAEIKKQLGLAAHHEMREADVLVLTVSNPGVIGLAVTKGGNSSDSRPGPGRFKFANMPIGDLSDFLEYVLGKPVIDETELSQKFSGSLKWNPQSDKAADLKEIQNALADQFGLQLVPSHQPVEMLVVEKAQ
jgi:uncharacterized protein (TIGR03435 family)